MVWRRRFAQGLLSRVATGLLRLAFWGSTIGLGAELRALLIRSVKLRFENLELIDDLSGAKDAAEAASRAKSLFLANVKDYLREHHPSSLQPVTDTRANITFGQTLEV